VTDGYTCLGYLRRRDTNKIGAQGIVSTATVEIAVAIAGCFERIARVNAPLERPVFSVLPENVGEVGLRPNRVLHPRRRETERNSVRRRQRRRQRGRRGPRLSGHLHR
jgi:hypothetical protein